MAIVINETKAPKNRPKIRQKVIIVLAKGLLFGLEAKPGPVIIHIDAT
jgi:hypothetical protein